MTGETMGDRSGLLRMGTRVERLEAWTTAGMQVEMSTSFVGLAGSYRLLSRQWVLTTY